MTRKYKEIISRIKQEDKVSYQYPKDEIDDDEVIDDENEFEVNLDDIDYPNEENMNKIEFVIREINKIAKKIDNINLKQCPCLLFSVLTSQMLLDYNITDEVSINKCIIEITNEMIPSIQILGDINDPLCHYTIDFYDNKDIFKYDNYTIEYSIWDRKPYFDGSKI